MNEHEDSFLQALELENSLPSTSQAQIEANMFRRKMYLLMKDRKPNYESSETHDLQLDMYINRMIDSNYRFCPSADWL